MPLWEEEAVKLPTKVVLNSFRTGLLLLELLRDSSNGMDISGPPCLILLASWPSFLDIAGFMIENVANLLTN